MDKNGLIDLLIYYSIHVPNKSKTSQYNAIEIILLLFIDRATRARARVAMTNIKHVLTNIISWQMYQHSIRRLKDFGYITQEGKLGNYKLTTTGILAIQEIKAKLKDQREQITKDVNTYL